jgi:HK97 gp10 family phage protein
MGTVVTGREALRALLLKLPKTAAVKLQASMTQSANDLAELQRSRVPVNTGALKDSIRVEPFNKGGIGAIIRAGGPTTTKPVRSGKSPSYDYSLGIELGTQEMLAHPFFYPSYRQQKPKIIRGAALAVKAAVAEIAP